MDESGEARLMSGVTEADGVQQAEAGASLGFLTSVGHADARLNNELRRGNRQEHTARKGQT
jgi:hypothetical protein